MHSDDKEKTTFITEDMNYYYRVMLFGLKNAGAMYQRLMNKVFVDQIGRNIEVYVDDMVAKMLENGDQCSDLAKIFEQIQQHNMRLNPEKCIFGVQARKFLSFMLTS